jgi:integrase
MRQALRPLKKLYGETPAENFGPLAIAAMQEHMIKLGWCRTNINKQIVRIRMCFKWGVSKQLIPSSVYEALRTVPALRAGRTEARESQPVKPVAESHAAAIFSFLSPQVQAMVELQALTGMRPGEVCGMRGCEITTPKDKTWHYSPAQHKTAHHGHTRIIDLGPRAREIVARFLKPDLQAHLFSPAEAEATRREKLHAQRTTPQFEGNTPGQIHRRFNGRYTVTNYRKAIQRACDRAFPPPKDLARQRVQANGRKKKATRLESDAEWRKRLGDRWAEVVTWRDKQQFHPHQLRHTAATRWRKEFGADAALVLLGDKTTRMIDVYAEKDREAATRIMEKIG